jgi:hypothetical protein
MVSCRQQKLVAPAAHWRPTGSRPASRSPAAEPEAPAPPRAAGGVTLGAGESGDTQRMRRWRAGGFVLAVVAIGGGLSTANGEPSRPTGGTGGRVAVTFRVGVVKEARAGRFRVVRVESGRRGGGAVAVVGAGDGSRAAGKIAEAFSEISGLATSWSAVHPPAHLDVRRHRDRVEVTASGANGLGALSAFLSTLDLQLDRWGALAAFLGIAIGIETTGASLGIAARDLDGTPLSVTLVSCQEVAGAPQALMEVRLSPHLSSARLEAPLHERTAAFTHRTGVPMDLTITPRP